MDNEGEAALIPTKIVEYSIKSAADINLDASLRLLASPSQSPSQVPNSSSSDPVLR